jgi:colicin import membrane protein
MRIRLQPIFLVLLLIVGAPLQAQENPLPVLRTPGQAEAQREQADAIRKQAQQRYAEEEAACQQKILVNACLDEAKERHTKALMEARRIDNPAKEFQREFRRGEVEAEKKRQAAERANREANQQEQAKRYRAGIAAEAAEREQRWQNKEIKAGENREKLADKQAKRRLKEEKRAKRQAGQIEKNAKKRAKAEKKAADKERAETNKD